MTFLGNKENSENLYWGVKTWEASVGEMKPRIFDLLGGNSVGRIFTRPVESGAWVVRQSTGEASQLGISQEVNCYLLDSQAFKITCWGNWGKLNCSHRGLIVGNLNSLGKKVLNIMAPLGICNSGFSGSTGDWEFEL